MKNNIKKLTKRIENSKRPVVLIGSGINISNTNNDLLKFINKYKIPVVSAWAIDAFPNHHAYYFGRQGSIGNRVGNYVVQFIIFPFRVFNNENEIRFLKSILNRKGYVR